MGKTNSIGKVLEMEGRAHEPVTKGAPPANTTQGQGPDELQQFAFDGFCIAQQRREQHVHPTEWPLLLSQQFLQHTAPLFFNNQVIPTVETCVSPLTKDRLIDLVQYHARMNIQGSLRPERERPWSNALAHFRLTQHMRLS